MLLAVVVVLFISLASCLPSNVTVCSQCSYHGACSTNASCVCLPNWSGHNCSNFTDPCSHTNPLCYNNATCVANNVPSVFNSSAYNYSVAKLHNFSWNYSQQCNCSSSHSGDRCELQYCDRAQCYNHGDCLQNTTTNLTFCNCNPHYNGTRCGDCIVCSGGSSLPCANINCNNGFCEIANGSYDCSCATGYTGTDCSTDVNECSVQPGICNYGNCVNDIGSYHCDCTNSGYYGAECNQELFECGSYPCKNGGTCSEVTGPGYQCGCLDGWSGNTCATHVCDYSSTCVFGDCAPSPSPFTCTCYSGYEGDNCDTESDECETVTCQNGGTCQDKVNAYSCLCSQGYEGTHCESKIDYCLSNACSNGICVSLLANYSCTCYAGYTGEYCEGNIDNCSPNPCINGSCIDGIGNFTCHCQSGYTGVTCGENIDDCSGAPCGVHGNCTDLLNNFTCSCEVGYTGDVCDELIDYCSTINCSNNGSCVSSNCTAIQCSSYMDFFSCVCAPGYTGSLCKDAIINCGNNSCASGACVEETVGYSCTCYSGFSGEFCTVNESSCTDNICKNGTCVESHPKYSCACYAGFEGELCGYIVYLCDNVTCLNGTCRQDNTTASCQCNSGFSGEFCTVNESSCTDNNCKNGTCVESHPKYSCACYAGFEGELCGSIVDLCDNVTCLNGTCRQDNTTASCQCYSGYYGEMCQFRNSCFNHSCVNGNCTQTNSSGYNCVCKEGFSGVYCENSIYSCGYKECENNATCNQTGDIGICVCTSGYTGESCDVRIPKCSSLPCKNSGVCTELSSGYNCTCPFGYSGDSCETVLSHCPPHLCNSTYGLSCAQLDSGNSSCYCASNVTVNSCEGLSSLCNSSVCANNGVCAVYGDSSKCVCHKNYTGDSCQSPTDPCIAKPCNTGYCVTHSQDEFECVCFAPATGQYCESLVLPCNETDTCYVPGSKSCVKNSTQETCLCHPAFSGGDCSSQLDCPTNLCIHASCCVVVNGTFECSTDASCLPHPCDYEPCIHGNCSGNGANYSCECSAGFTGQHCDAAVDFCSQVDCANGGTCENGTDAPVCSCKPNHHGQLCLFEAPETEYLFDDCVNTSCRYVFNNGVCDTNCAVKESCLYDGLDCLEILTCPSSDCETIYGNEACDNQCNNEACLFDGGDCLPDYISYNQEFASGSLLITVKSPSTSYSFNILALPQLMFRISKILRTVVVVEFVSELDRNSRVSRAAEGYEYKYRISSRIENSLCRDYCFRSTDKAVDYLNAYLINNSIDTSEYSVLEITSSEESSQWERWPIVTGVSSVTIVLLLIIAIGGVIIGKKRSRGVFFPRRLTAGTNSSERAALVGSRADTEDPDSISIQFASESGKEYSAKRVKQSSISSCASVYSDTRPPPYEYFQQSLPGGCLSKSQSPMREHNPTSFPLSSIELDHLLVGSPSATHSPSTSLTPESVNSRGIGGYTPISLAVIIGNPTACGFLPFPALPASHPPPCSYGSAHQPAVISDLLSVEDLVRLGADVDIPNDRGATPLHLAATYSRSDVAGSLIAAGARVNAVDKLGRTPLHSAVASGSKGVFHILLTNRNLNIDQQSLDGSTALMLGARHLSNDFVHEMLRADANANLFDKNGYTALHWAAAVDNAVAIQTLISHSADLNYPNCRGETPLFVAAKEGSADCVRALLQNSASSQITDFFGRSPITIASERLHKDIEHILTNPAQSCKLKMDDKPNLVCIKSKSTASSKAAPNTTKTDNRKVKKFTPPGSKVHPFSPISPVDSNLSLQVKIKLEVPSPEHTPVISISPVLPLSTDYFDQIQDYDTSPNRSKFKLTHPYPTPPNIHSEFLKPQQTSEAAFSSHYPSPESSHNTVSPPNHITRPFTLVTDANYTNACYPDHFSNSSCFYSNQRDTLTEPDWEEFDCS